MRVFTGKRSRIYFAQFIAFINTSKIFGIIPYFSGIRLIKLLCRNNWVIRNHFSDQVTLIKDHLRLAEREDECDDTLINNYLTSTDFLSKWRFRTVSKVKDGHFYKRVKIEGLDIFESELQKGRGIILAASHFGQIELLFSFLNRYKNDIYYLVKDTSLNEIYRKNAADFVLNISTGSREETFALLSKVKTLLEEGNVLLIPGDGEYGNSTVDIEFLGKIRQFRKGFADFALLTGSAIIPVLTYTDGKGVPSVKFYEAIEYSNQYSNHDDETVAIIKKYAKILEKNWSEHPHNIIPHYLKIHSESPDFKKPEGKENDFILLQWIVTTSCNMNCEYCYAVGMVNNARENRSENTLEIASRIVGLSSQYKRMRLDITGGEILTFKDLGRILEIIGPAKNIELGIFTNAINFPVIESSIERFVMINISLHVKYRTDKEIDSIIDHINRHKHKTNIVLSQVDYELSEEDHRKLARIESETKVSIFFQTYIKPYFILEENDQDEDFSGLFINSKNKVCAMNCFAFTILPDGRLFYDLACRKATRKTGHFLDSIEDLDKTLTDNHPRECPYQFCYNNYNIFFFEEYQAICDRFAIDVNSRFTKENLSEYGILKKDLVNTKHAFWIEKLKNEALSKERSDKAFENMIQDIPDKASIDMEIARLKQTYSWRIGYAITRIIRFFLSWIPQIRRM